MSFSTQTPNNKAISASLPPPVVETLTSLVTAVDAKDPFTNSHSQKVSSYAFALAGMLELDTAAAEEIRFAALLHDLGKVGIPETLLNKNGPLDSEEWELMKQHVELGARILEKCNGFERIRAMVRHHHEFFDGSGYPQGLSGESIPLGARIIAIADAYDTITSERTYKRPRPAEEALAELERCGGAQFDPELVTLFLRAMRRLPSPIFEITPATEKVVAAGPTT
jgi:putative nucleotidyltransferase with HDIG domain